MRKQLHSSLFFLCLCVLGAGLPACHPDDNDPKGQAGDLSDPVRRTHALERLQSIFGTRLSEAKGDRNSPGVKEFNDATVETLTKTYLEHPEDLGNGETSLRLMSEMRDPRALPALIKALDWKVEMTENQAQTAAQTLGNIDIPADKKGEVIEGLSKALLRIDGARGIDNRLRIAFLQELGKLKDKRCVDALTKIALKRDASQNFLINRIAATQLVGIADPSSVPTFIQGLYWFDANNPAMRMNDIATSGLVAIGKPSLAPLLKVLRGEDETANTVVKDYIAAIKQKDPEAARKFDPRSLVAIEASYSLGKLGYRDAIAPLIEESKSADKMRATAAAIALVSVVRTNEDTAKIVEALIRVYGALDPMEQPQLLVAIRHLYAADALPFLLNVATGAKGKGKDKEKPSSTARMYAFQSYALLANKAEIAPLKALFDKESLFKENLSDHAPLLAVTATCDANVECWTGKLKNKDKLMLRKSASMLARFGRGDEKAIHALVDLFGHRDLEVRNEALGAVDAMAVTGSREAVKKITDLESAEAGRAIWEGFQREALPARSRLQLRGGTS
ncbi:MAG: hypothetical protein RL701_1014 [Pseudomonadota bacterium]